LGDRQKANPMAHHKITHSSSKIIFTLLAGQSLFSAAMILTFTVASIQAVDLADGNEIWTGIPSTVALVASALISYPVGWIMDAYGRRVGLVMGYLLGGRVAVAGGGSRFAGSIPDRDGRAGAGGGAVELGRYVGG
jgi:MFS family permease